ncbi:MAG: nitrous oxide reductase accessory protein NosL [Dehalococcoidia bacterium]
MTTRRRFLALLGTGTVVAGAAAAGYLALPGEEAPTGDPRIRYGGEPCARCGMIISDERFAAAWRAGREETHFDDIGCMVAMFRQHHPAGEVTYFVRDYSRDAWLDATAAVFVRAPGVKSPMSYDIPAFATRDAADQALKNRADTSQETWAALLDGLKERG